MFKLKCDDFLTYDEATGTYSIAPDQQVRDEVEKKRWKDIGLTVLKDWRLYLMLVPMLLVYILWKYLPITELLAVFKDVGTNGGMLEDLSWSGFDNFGALIAGSGYYGTYYNTFWSTFRNTFIIAFYGLLFGFPFPIILALFFNEVRSNIARSIMQVCVYLPKFMSVVVITTLIISLFGGTGSNGILAKAIVGIFGSDSVIGQATQTGIVYSTRYFRGIFIISELWEHAGYDSIVFFAAVIAVSPTSYEAAQIDGAGKMAQMRYVVIPSILSTVVIMLIMKIGSLLSVSYEKVYLYVQGSGVTNRNGNYYIGATVSVWANGMTTNQPIGMAGEMITNLLGMILVIGSNAVSRKATDVSLY
ncbi:MAG: sugar ABC transporter permease [Clostridia bacterium]|nr:sugar ABC transporter permease [Clostridia bacterium]MCD8040882.1 sugar ABC transporter permease [Clostridia bacterium]